jgi:hypothetical protein
MASFPTCAHHAACHSPADRISTHFLIFFLFPSSPFVFLTHTFPQIWIAGGDGSALVFDCSLVWGSSIAGFPHRWYHGVRLMPFLLIALGNLFTGAGAANRLNENK